MALSRVGTRRRGVARTNFGITTTGITPFDAVAIATGKPIEGSTLLTRVPDPIEFIVSDQYLNRPNLYPKQATFIKLIFLRDDMFTEFDLETIGEWEEKFRQTGNEGLNPGVMDRIRINQEAGRSWFRETQAVIGRRGSKGFLGGLAGAYVTWVYMMRPGGPQEYYGIDRDKRLTGIVFAGKKEQARDNLWRDWFNVIVGGSCFSQYISRPQAERLTLWTPQDLINNQSRMIEMENDTASIEIVPAPSTMMAARGPASFGLMFDEQAHVINSNSAADAEAVYDAATPALDQFGVDGFIYAPSSPWRKTGKFYENWQHAIEMDTAADGTKTPAYPERLMLQLPSWGIYERWDEAERLPVRPPRKVLVSKTREVRKRQQVDGKRTMVTVEEEYEEEALEVETFQRLKSAVQTFDDQMRRLERANPDTFAVERRSHWAESIDAYLNSMMVDRAYLPWDGNESKISARGILDRTYMAHGDPATSNKRFGWGLGHRVWVPDLDENGKPIPGEGWYHAVLDLVRCWEPGDYEDHILDYDDVMGDIEDDVKVFVPEDVSFDQFNVPATIGRLRKWVRKQPLPKAVHVHEVTRTRPLNWKHSELFKSALNMGLVHIPLYSLDGTVNYASDQGMLELKFLEEKNGKVDHPDTGPIQSKDIADAIMETVVSLIGKQMATFLGMELDDLGLSGSAEKGTDPYRHQKSPQERLAETMGGRGQAGGGGAARGSMASRGGMRRR